MAVVLGLRMRTGKEVSLFSGFVYWIRLGVASSARLSFAEPGTQVGGIQSLGVGFGAGTFGNPNIALVCGT